MESRSYCIAQGTIFNAQCPIMEKNTKKNAYVCTTESLCSTAEINATL